MARQSIIPFTSSLYFDGVNDYISGLTNTARTAGQPIAWFARIKALNTGTCIVGSRNGSGAGQLSKIGISATGLLSFDHDTTGAGGTVSGVSDIRNRWVSVVGVYNGATLRVYVNGTLENTLARANCVLSSTTMAIGRRADTSAEYFKGYMNSVATSYDTITDSDVLYWHTTNILPAGKTLHKEYQLSEGSGTTATDTSGNGNNGTINNGAIWYTTDMYSRARTAASNRRVIQDMKASLYFDGTSSHVSGLSTPVREAGRPFAMGVWFKTTARNSDIHVMGARNGSTAGDLYKFGWGSNNIGRMSFEYDPTGSGGTAAPTGYYNDGRWHQITGVYDGTDIINYIDGVEVARVTAKPNAAIDQTTFYIARRPDASSEFFPGSLAKAWVIDDSLTAEEVLSFYRTGVIPSGKTYFRRWDLNEGAGSTVYDLSGNANNGTINSATFTLDVPSRKRKLVGGNLIYNGDLEYAPPFTAATLVNIVGRFINGTASGSTTNNLFGWAVGTNVAFNVQGSYDTTVSHSGAASLKLSNLTTSSAARGLTVPGVNYSSLAEAQRVNLIPVLPNTSYTLTLWCKTNNAVASSVYAQAIEISGALGAGTANSTNNTGGTSDWTQLTKTFTTASTARYIGLLLKNDTTGNISDAWFDDITLVKN